MLRVKGILSAAKICIYKNLKLYVHICHLAWNSTENSDKVGELRAVVQEIAL